MPTTSADCYAPVHKLREASSLLSLEYKLLHGTRGTCMVHGRGEISPLQEGVECRILFLCLDQSQAISWCVQT